MSVNAKSQLKSPNFKFWFTVLPFTFYLLPFICYAQPLSSTELINNARQYDGKTVTYTGEVIGEIMARGKFCWLNVNDGNNAIGVWIDKNLVKDLTYMGSYKSKGDGVEISGTFHRACLQHGGDLDIHAQGLRKIKSGRPDIDRKSVV